MTIPFHSLADLFPLIEGPEFEALVRDIAENGVREQIVVKDGQILDGRNRYRAAIRAAIITEDTEPQLNRRDGLFIDFDANFTADPLSWVLSKNLHRRHLSESQRATIAARLENLGVGRPADYAKGGIAGAASPGKDANLHHWSPVKRADAADMLHVSPRSVASARQVIDHGAPDLTAAVERGDIKVSVAAELTSLPVDEQVRLIEQADPKAIREVARRARAEKLEVKKQARQERERALGAKQVALGAADGVPKFGVVYADPEWTFEARAESGMERSAQNHYPTSTLEAIKARGVPDVIATDAALFLWATVPLLPEALEVMAAWGFTYRSHLVWTKDRAGTGYWFRNAHELLLVGTRGNVPAPAPDTQPLSTFAANVGAHSEKPLIFAGMIERMFPTLPKLELNRRGAPRPGWWAWGNEVEGADANGFAFLDAAVGSSAAVPGTPAGETADDEANGLIEAAYAAGNVDLAALSAQTGLTRTAIKMRAWRRGWSDPSNQSAAVARSNARRGEAAQ
ncbi:MAG: S-adenosylmethionine-binding protein [Hyphomicrobiaceae bacterium]|nr:S-adenosylmethionine-binding protein [Hyphomicrobiaceae bacterium]